jgi:hypothetical protein
MQTGGHLHGNHVVHVFYTWYAEKSKERQFCLLSFPINTVGTDQIWGTGVTSITK